MELGDQVIVQFLRPVEIVGSRCARAISLSDEGIPVRAERADRKSVVGQLLLEIVQRRFVRKHRQLAMRIARIIAGAQFDRRNVERAQLFEDFFERELR